MSSNAMDNAISATTSRPMLSKRRRRTVPTSALMAVSMPPMVSARTSPTPSASPDEMVVKVYPLDHETTYLRASFERRRARNPGGGIALAGCLHLTPLPDPARQLSGRECLPDRPRAGMQPANRPQRHPRLQREGSPASASSRLQTSAHRSQGLPGSSTGRGLAGAFAPHAQGLRKRHKPVDAGLGRRGQLRRRPYR